MYSTLFVIALSVWQLCVARSLQPEEYSEIRHLSTEELERLASWTEDDKQNKWELSGQFEGDIILARNQRNVIKGKTYRWPKKEIPYEIDSNFTIEQKNWIIDALNEIRDKTCIKPRARTSTDEDYVYVTGYRVGCASSVGRVGGKQTLNLDSSDNLGEGCFNPGSIVHEFVHTLGFYHQQGTIGRDKHIRIEWDNIREGNKYNFRQLTKGEITNYGLPYDYGSLMHYSAYAFTKNGNKTIVTKDPDAIIGQRDGLSKIDIMKLKIMYKCPTDN